MNLPPGFYFEAHHPNRLQFIYTERTSAVEIILVSGKMGEGLRFCVSDLTGKDQIWLDKRKDKVSGDCLTMNET